MLLGVDVSIASKDICFSNWDEWMRVRHGLYSENRIEQQRALDIVNMWRQRRDIPPSVDATAHFVEVKLQDGHFLSDSEGSNGFRTAPSSSLRLLYSMAIVRAVNGLVDADPQQQQSFFAQSVLAAAEKIGVPGWIVELRHDGTHKQLPSMSVLRAAAVYMLDWFNNHYWTAQHQNVEEILKLCLQPVLQSGKDAQFRATLMKCCESSSFVTEMLLPNLVDAFCAIPVSPCAASEVDLLVEADRLFEESHNVWKSTIDVLLHMNDTEKQPARTQWISPFICRLLLALSSAMKGLSNGDRILSIQSLLLERWIVLAVQLYANEKKRFLELESVLQRTRWQFARTQWIALCDRYSFPREPNAVLQRLQSVLQVLWDTESPENVQRESTGKRKRDDDMLQVVTLPLWPLGLCIGATDCCDLLDIEVLN